MESKWISVKDCKPDNNTRCFVYKLNNALHGVTAAYYNNGRFYFDGTMLPDGYDELHDKIVLTSHWMPIPEFPSPPTEQQD